MEGHSALVYFEPVLYLSQRLNRICQADGVQLVNIVQKKDRRDTTGHANQQFGLRRANGRGSAEPCVLIPLSLTNL